MKIFGWCAAVILYCAFVPAADAQWSASPTVNTPICTAASFQTAAAISSDGSGGAIIAWLDNRSSVYHIYAQRINSSGVAQWTADGVAICTASSGRQNISIVADGSGGAIMAWADTRGSSNDVYAQRINSSGIVQWTANGVAICAATDHQYPNSVLSDGAGGAIISWDDYRNGSSNCDVYAQRVNALGVVRWATNGVAVGSGSADQGYSCATSDGTGGAIIAWADKRSGTSYDIYAQRMDTSGAALWTANGVALCTATGDQLSRGAIGDGSGGAIIAWGDFRSGTNSDIYARRINSSGTVQWTANGVAICTAADQQDLPKITTDGVGGAIMAWADYRSGSNYDIYAQMISSAGVTQWSINGEVVSTGTGDQEEPRIISDGNGGAIATWRDTRNGNYDIYAQLINSGGGSEWTANGVGVCTRAETQVGSALTSDGINGTIIVWEDSRNADANSRPDIYVSRVPASGTMLPVEMRSFTATPTNFSVQLKWTTATEVNNYGFEIERTEPLPNPPLIGEGSKGWARVGFAEGAGSSNTPKEYSFVDKNLRGGSYSYRLKQIDRNGSFKYTEAVAVGYVVPRELTLSQNYPNPFNPSTTIEFTLPEHGRVVLTVHDVLGKEVATLVNADLEAGVVHRATFDASNISSGIYFFRLKHKDNQLMKKLLVMK